MIYLPQEKLQHFAAELLTAAGLDSEDASGCAESLVGANLRGYESHGVMRIPFYIDMIKAGDIRLDARFEIEKESPTHLVVNANWGLGQTQALKLANQLGRKCKVSGMAIGTMYQSGHIGRLGEYCEKAAEQGLISMVMVNTHGAARRVSPPGGKRPTLGTNPIAIGVPHQQEPLILDFSTSATAEGKVRVKKIAGETCPEGWLIDSNGQPTTDPNSLYADPPGSILPFGGTQMYKGFGLALMVDLFTGALSGGLTSRETPETPKGNCVFMMMIDPEKFGGAEHFTAEVKQLNHFVRGCPTAEGVTEIVLPGDPERRISQERQKTGLPFDQENWNQLLELAQQLEVSAPAVTN